MTTNSEHLLVLHLSAGVRFTPEIASRSPTPRYLEHNLKVFRAFDLMDDRLPGERVDPESSVALELRRLDAKMSLVLELMLELLRADEPDVQQAEVALDSRGVTWSPSAPSLSLQQTGTLELFIHPGLPRPLRFPGTVVTLDSEASRVRVDFVGLYEQEMDELERLIFRRHRRKVADVRGMKRPG